MSVDKIIRWYTENRLIWRPASLYVSKYAADNHKMTSGEFHQRLTTIIWLLLDDIRWISSKTTNNYTSIFIWFLFFVLYFFGDFLVFSSEEVLLYSSICSKILSKTISSVFCILSNIWLVFCILSNIWLVFCIFSLLYSSIFVSLLLSLHLLILY